MRTGPKPRPISTTYPMLLYGSAVSAEVGSYRCTIAPHRKHRETLDALAGLSGRGAAGPIFRF